MTGGCGFCTGFGQVRMFGNSTISPWYSGSDLVQISLHRLDLLTHLLEASFEDGAVILDLVLVPPAAYSNTAERDHERLGAQNLQQRIDQCGFADAGATGDCENFGGQSDADSLSLAAGERQLCSPLDPRDRLIGINRGPRRSSDGSIASFSAISRSAL